jgi:hypothetical protein
LARRTLNPSSPATISTPGSRSMGSPGFGPTCAEEQATVVTSRRANDVRMVRKLVSGRMTRAPSWTLTDRRVTATYLQRSVTPTPVSKASVTSPRQRVAAQQNFRRVPITWPSHSTHC